MTYDSEFYAIEDHLALRSALYALPPILAAYDVQTVIDIGCGTGSWAFVAKQLGCATLGVDRGVPADMLHNITYLDADLTDGYPCGGSNLAICLEVAEHLPEHAAEPLVAGLARADRVLFSAATPGQPGVGHIHCMPHEYWHDLFARHGKTWTKPDLPVQVADFYRRNAFLYA